MIITGIPKDKLKDVFKCKSSTGRMVSLSYKDKRIEVPVLIGDTEDTLKQRINKALDNIKCPYRVETKGKING